VTSRGMRTWVLWLASGIAFGWMLSLAWWFVLEPASASDDVYELVIPSGTAAAVAAGERPPLIPNSLSLGRNRKMIVRNEDVVDHAVGAWTVPPGGVAEIEADKSSGQLTCTIHPAGVLGLSIDGRPAFRSTFNGALMLGIPLGVVFGFAGFVGSKLQMDDEAPSTPAS
jgi:hypothetical protein